MIDVAVVENFIKHEIVGDALSVAKCCDEISAASAGDFTCDWPL